MYVSVSCAGHGTLDSINIQNNGHHSNFLLVLHITDKLVLIEPPGAHEHRKTLFVPIVFIVLHGLCLFLFKNLYKIKI